MRRWPPGEPGLEPFFRGRETYIGSWPKSAKAQSGLGTSSVGTRRWLFWRWRPAVARPIRRDRAKPAAEAAPLAARTERAGPERTVAGPQPGQGAAARRVGRQAARASLVSGRTRRLVVAVR